MTPAHVNRLAALSRPRSKAGFTLVEILLAAVITVVLVGILLRITTLATTSVSLSTQALTAFTSARTAFDVMTQNLSQATLNTYLDYYDTSGNRRTNSNITSFAPATFGRASDLQFLVWQNGTKGATTTPKNGYGQEVYFQAPRAYSTDATLQSTTGLLNACGYYVLFGGNQLYEPAAVSSLIAAGKEKEKYRYRLMQAMEPTEKLSVFSSTAVSGSSTDLNTWLANIQNPPSLGSAYVSPLADNVIALVIWPRMSVNDDPTGYGLLLQTPTDSYCYDSQLNVKPKAPTTAGQPYSQVLTADQLPPDVMVTMVVLDEASAARMAATMAATPTQPPTQIETALGTKFSTADQYSNDLSNLSYKLTLLHVNFQFFSTTVAMRESKWTQGPLK